MTGMIKHQTWMYIPILSTINGKSLSSYVIADVMTMTRRTIKLTAVVVVKKSLFRILYSDVTHMKARTVCLSSKKPNHRTTNLTKISMISTRGHRPVKAPFWWSQLWSLLQIRFTVEVQNVFKSRIFPRADWPGYILKRFDLHNSQSKLGFT